MGDYLFTAVSEQGVSIAEISYPTQPDIRGGIITPGYAHGLSTTSDSAFLLVATGEMGLSIFNISDFQNGYGTYLLSGWCDTPGYAEEVVIKDQEPVAFLACGTAGLQIVNFADTNNVFITGSYDGKGYAKDIIYKNNKVYMTAETAGLQVYDVSNLSNPKLIGEIDTEYALGLTMDDNYLYVSDEIEGVLVIKMP
jgi:hypothetical protein